MEIRELELRLTKPPVAEVRLANVRRVEDLPAEVRNYVGVLVTPRVLGTHPLLNESNVVGVGHTNPSSNSSGPMSAKNVVVIADGLLPKAEMLTASTCRLPLYPRNVAHW